MRKTFYSCILSVLIATTAFAQSSLSEFGERKYPDNFIHYAFTATDVAGVYSLGPAYPTATLDFEFGATFDADLYECDTQDGAGDGDLSDDTECSLLVSLASTSHSRDKMKAKKLWYVLQINTAGTSSLTIKGSWDQVAASEDFYGIDVSGGANAAIFRYDFNLPIPGTLRELDRSNMTAAPTNWETDTGSSITANGLSPFRILMSGTAPSGLFFELANAIIKADEAGNYGVKFNNDTVSDVSISMYEYGPKRWLNELAGPRKYAIEFNVAITDLDGFDFFMGVCDAAPVLNSTGTIAPVRYVGFHFLQSDGNPYPVLAKTNGGVTTLPFPTITQATISSVGQPIPDNIGPSGYNRYAIKGISQSEFEWYINDQLVGYSAYDAAKQIFLELSICMGFVTESTTGLTEAIYVDRIISVMEDNQIY